MGPAFGHGSDLVHQNERSRPQFQLQSFPQYHLQSLRQSLRSLRDSDDIRLGWDPRPRHLYHNADLGGPGPPSGPAHQARVSHSHPGLSHRQPHLQRRRHHRLSCHLPPGSEAVICRAPHFGECRTTLEGLSSGVVLRCPYVGG